MVITLKAGSDIYHPLGDRFLEQVHQLAHELRREGLQTADQAIEGKKGEILQPLIEITGGGASVGLLLRIIRTWILQRGDRIVELTTGADRSWKLTGKNVSDETLLQVAKELQERDDDGR